MINVEGHDIHCRTTNATKLRHFVWGFVKNRTSRKIEHIVRPRWSAEAKHNETCMKYVNTCAVSGRAYLLLRAGAWGWKENTNLLNSTSNQLSIFTDLTDNHACLMTPSLKIIAKQINPIATVRAMLDVFFLLLWFVSLDPASREGNGGTKNAKEIGL